MLTGLMMSLTRNFGRARRTRMSPEPPEAAWEKPLERHCSGGRRRVLTVDST